MSEDDAISELLSLSVGDREEAHVEADNILLEFLRKNGHESLADAYVDVRAAIGFWYA